ncbi:MAG: diguanylate cyclase [Pirellulales bacterium]
MESTFTSLECEMQTQDFIQKTLDSLQSHIAILDENGTIIAVNAAWNAFASSNDLAAKFCGPGVNYLLSCDRATGACSEEAHVVAAEIRSVIKRQRNDFYMENPCHSPDEQRWFCVRITRFEINDVPRIVVAHDNITKRKLAELKLLAINRGLKHQTLVDELTGIANRRCFDQELESQWQRHRRNFNPISVLLIDIDRFKQYNDSCGHLMGDDCLRTVAQAIDATITDERATVARYGGEEIGVILPGRSAADAYSVAEAVCCTIAELEIPHPSSTAHRFVTVSAGCATCQAVLLEHHLDLLNLADEALYAAKERGRNQVIATQRVAASPTPLEAER